MDISIVIPVFNEEENVSILHGKLVSVLNKIGKKYEIIFVDDGSKDKTFKKILGIRNEDSNVKIIQFNSNYGKASALSAAFNEVKGEIVITMDGDLQDDPEEIPNFIQKIDSDYDLVCGWKYKRKDPLSKTIPSKFFNFITNILTGVRIHDSNCGFKAYKLEVVRNVRDLIYGELHRYIPSIAHQKGFKITEIPVTHHKRIYGKSKYGVRRILRGILDLLTIRFLIKNSNSPLHLFGSIGLIMIFFGGIIGLRLTFLWLKHIPIGTRPILFLAALLILIGMQFLGLGLIAELLVNVNKTKGNENYVIKKKYG